MSLNDISLYLPKYLSVNSTKELLRELDSFPDNIDKRFYSNLMDEIVFQGDGLIDLPVVKLPIVDLTLDQKNTACLVISNTCDTDLNNPRLFPSQITYSPIIDLEKYKTSLLKYHDENKINSHIESIKLQKISQILFLPSNGVICDSIVFLDRIFNIKNDHIKRNELKTKRLFSLSNYGFYVFLFKISVHFTRVQEKVDRISN